MNSSTPKRIITVASPNSSGRWSTSKRKFVEMETGLSVLARLETRPSVFGLEPPLIPDGPNPGDIIELTGSAGSGKSVMVLHLILSVLLPRTWKGVRLGGCEGGVIFVDNDMHFNILHLENMFQKRVSIYLKHCKSVMKGKSGDLSDKKDLIDCAEDFNEFLRSGKQCFSEELNKLTKECLKNFLYLRCSDSTQFAVTLLSMNELFQSNGNVSLVVIDSISAFYWYDRTYRADTWYKLEQFYNRIFKVFLGYIKKHKVVLISTRQSLFQKRKKRDGYSSNRYPQLYEESVDDVTEYEYMGKEWAKSITCRICLSITRCPILAIGGVVTGSNSLDPSTKPVKDLLKGQGNDGKDGMGSGKINSDRTQYSAEVTAKERKAKLLFTIHEEGIRWIARQNTL